MELFMKKILMILSLTMSSAAFAISDASLAKKCEAKGLEKLITAAQAANCDFVRESLQAVDVDNRFYNPSKYVWYAFAAKCGDDDLFKAMKIQVQYNSSSRECL
jgi:hypothetical protein